MTGLGRRILIGPRHISNPGGAGARLNWVALVAASSNPQCRYPDSSYATANGIWSQLSKVEFSLLKPARPTPPRRTDRRSGPVLALVLGLVPGGGASSGGASRPVELAFKRHLIGTRKRNRAGGTCWLQENQCARSCALNSSSIGQW